MESIIFHELTNYELAEYNRKYLEKIYDPDTPHMLFCVAAAETCVLYLKHIIKEYYKVQQYSRKMEKNNILRGKNIYFIIDFIEEKMDVKINREDAVCIRETLNYIDNDPLRIGPFRINLLSVNRKDMEICMEAMKRCKKVSDELIQIMEKRFYPDGDDEDEAEMDD